MGGSGANGASGATGAVGADGTKLLTGVCSVGGGPVSPACSAAVNKYLFFCRDGRFFSCTNNVWVLIDDLSGPSGGLGGVGTAGATGPSGASGAYADQTLASQQVWSRLVPGASVAADDVAPACMADYVGVVSLRGHVTLNLSPVPQTGGQLLAVLPRRGGACPCSPSDANPVVATTTALTLPTPATLPGAATVCIVRLLVSRSVAADVNGDRVVDAGDEQSVTGSPLFGTGTSCGQGCGPADVNLDGFVNALDAQTVRNSTLYPTDVSCGAVYATSFSCGAYRASPPAPAIGVSLDEVNYRTSAGVLSSSRRQTSVDVEVVYRLLAETAGAGPASEALLRGGERLERLTQGGDKLQRREWQQLQLLEARADGAARHKLVLTDVLVAVCVVAICSALTTLALRRRA